MAPETAPKGRHLVATNDGPFLCNGSRDGVWTLDPAKTGCAACLRARVAALEAERDDLEGRNLLNRNAVRLQQEEVAASRAEAKALRDDLEEIVSSFDVAWRRYQYVTRSANMAGEMNQLRLDVEAARAALAAGTAGEGER